jgi:ABC-type branched-subunit amino acid transport system substrate-binding protein
MKKHSVRLSIVASLAALIGATSLLPLGAGLAPAASSEAPITIALITSESGPAAAEFSDAPAGFKARIALQNAEGGVDGHKLVALVVDDQTTNAAQAAQSAIAKGAFGIVADSPLFTAAAKYPEQAGMPVTGASVDGPEWGTPPYTNMFASDTGSLDPKYPAGTAFGDFLKGHGGTVLGSYAYGVVPSSLRSATGTALAFQHAGGKEGVLDTSIPFGSTAMTSVALAAKEKGVNAVFTAMDNNTNFALATALKQAGVHLKALVFPTGFESDVVGSPAWSSLQGDYFVTQFRPAQLPDAGTRQLVSALQKYEHRPPSKFPDLNIYESWLGADLMIKGLQLAGANPTRAAVVKDLRHLKSYNGNGLLPESINYSTIFGHDLPKGCGWYMRATKTGFVPTSSQPFCGHDIPGTSTATS